MYTTDMIQILTLTDDKKTFVNRKISNELIMMLEVWCKSLLRPYIQSTKFVNVVTCAQRLWFSHQTRTWSLCNRK